MATLTLHGYSVVGAAATAAEAVAAARSTLPDIALVDIRLPDLSGDRLCPLLREAVPGISLIILTTDPSEEMVRRAVAMGVADYVTKAAGQPELLAALDRVRSKLQAGKPQEASEIVPQLEGLTAKRLQVVPLTPQQESVLESGRGGIDQRRDRPAPVHHGVHVRFHFGKLREAFDARSKTELVAKAFSTGACSPALDAHRG